MLFLMVAAVFAFLDLAITGVAGTFAGTLMLVLMLAISGVVGVLLGLFWPSFVYRTILKRDPRQLARNATVLYHHLRQAYADVEEPTPAP